MNNPNAPASLAQVKAVLSADALLRRQRGNPARTPFQSAGMRAKLLKMSRQEISKVIQEANKRTGFSKHSADATPEQRERIAQLEAAIYGTSRTTTFQTLSWADADLRVQELAAMKKDNLAGIEELIASATAGVLR